MFHLTVFCFKRRSAILLMSFAGTAFLTVLMIPDSLSQYRKTWATTLNCTLSPMHDYDMISVCQ